MESEMQDETSSVINDNDHDQDHEDHDQFATPHENFDEIEFEKNDRKLEERLKILKEAMNKLKEQLSEEKEAWKKEITEAMNVAKIIGVPCVCEHELDKGDSKSACDLELDIEPTLGEISLMDYEQKLASYQEVLTRTHTQKRNYLKRHLAANAYKKRLLEVENMCNLELLKVKQSVQFLQPLQELASGWGDFQENDGESSLTGSLSKIPLDFSSVKSCGDGVKCEKTVTDIKEQKLYNDFKDLTSHLSPSSSHPTCSSLCMTDDDDLMTKRIQSMSWYNNEMGHTSAFNPLM